MTTENKVELDEEDETKRVILTRKKISVAKYPLTGGAYYYGVDSASYGEAEASAD